MRLRAPQRLQHEDLLQRPFLEVEDHGVPARGDDLVRVALQAHPAEVGARVLGRIVDGLGDLVVGDEPVDGLGLLQLEVEALARADVVVLEVDHLHPRVVPVQVVLGDVVLDELLLDDPVQLAPELHRDPRPAGRACAPSAPGPRAPTARARGPGSTAGRGPGTRAAGRSAVMRAAVLEPDGLAAGRGRARPGGRPPPGSSSERSRSMKSSSTMLSTMAMVPILR